MYSSPGLDLRQKQLLTCAFLAEAAMPDQLFGHALAGLRCVRRGKRVRAALEGVPGCWRADKCFLDLAASLDVCGFQKSAHTRFAHICHPHCWLGPGPTHRFGNSYSALEEAAAVACEMGPRQPAAKEVTLKAAVTTLGLVRC